MCKKLKPYCQNRLSVFLIIFLALAPITAAAEPESPESPPDREVTAMISHKVLTRAELQLKERVTFSCRDMSLDLVLDQLSREAKIDIIKSPTESQNVTVTVTDAPLDEVLNNILSVQGWTYTATENMIKVTPLSEIDIEEIKTLTSIYRITFADVTQVASALKDFLSKKGTLAVNKGTSHIIITDVESKIRAIDKFIIEVDRPTQQVMVEVRIFDITTTESFDIGVEWAAGRHTPLTEVTRTGSHKRTDTELSPTDTYETTITESDDPDATAPLITKTVTTQKPGTTGFSIEDVFEENTEDKSWLTDSEGNRLPIRRSKPFVGGSFSPSDGGTLRFGLFNDMIDVEFALSMLQSEVKAKLLANPRVLVLDNETAQFKIVSEIPYTERTGSSLGQMTSITFKEVGVQLDVTPHICRDGMIRLDISPEFGVVTEQVQIEGSGIERSLAPPVVDKRFAKTIALVNDGQTVVLGGLRKMETRTTIKKVPILGDLPILGGLFRSETDREEINELVVFITTTIIKEHQLSETEARQLAASEILSK
jgi:type IV pilus assembly protein PilQ